MATSDPGPDPGPVEILLKTADKCLKLSFDDGTKATLPAEYLRVWAPSADVAGHGGEDRRIVPGKAKVGIVRLEPVGHYAIRIVFDDGHASGFYTWRYLYELATTYEEKWAAYLEALTDRGLSR